LPKEGKEKDGLLGNWRMAAFKCFLRRERIRAKVGDALMKSYKVGIETAGAGPEVCSLETRNWWKNNTYL
jgi:hypothetical protein